MFSRTSGRNWRCNCKSLAWFWLPLLCARPVVVLAWALHCSCKEPYQYWHGPCTAAARNPTSTGLSPALQLQGTLPVLAWALHCSCKEPYQYWHGPCTAAARKPWSVCLQNESLPQTCMQCYCWPLHPTEDQSPQLLNYVCPRALHVPCTMWYVCSLHVTPQKLNSNQLLAPWVNSLVHMEPVISGRARACYFVRMRRKR